MPVDAIYAPRRARRSLLVPKGEMRCQGAAVQVQLGPREVFVQPGCKEGGVEGLTAW